MKNFIIQKESNTNVRQWHLHYGQIIAISSAIILLITVAIFLSADALSNYLYEKRLSEFKSNYLHIAKNVESLRSKLVKIDEKIDILENKDNAVRTYAGMPKIDLDIRKLGIGGNSLKPKMSLDNLAPVITEELVALEMDVEKLSREINLEMNSYNEIYDKVKDNIHRISKIPSIRPVNGGFLNSSFGYRNDPIDNIMRFHQGQDITVNSGTPIYAPANGTVKRAYYAGGFGKHIKLDHGDGYTTLFAHLSKINVKHGQKVKRGDIIGLTGNTGRSTAPHLHYEIHHYGEPKNPLDFFFHLSSK